MTGRTEAKQVSIIYSIFTQANTLIVVELIHFALIFHKYDVRIGNSGPSNVEVSVE